MRTRYIREHSERIYEEFAKQIPKYIGISILAGVGVLSAIIMFAGNAFRWLNERLGSEEYPWLYVGATP